MNRILTLLMIIVLAVAPASMLSAAVCRHHSAIEHDLARASADARIANAARTEETATLLAKKGMLADEASGSFLADMLPMAGLTPPFDTAERLKRLLANENALPGASVRPLLEPPAA